MKRILHKKISKFKKNKGKIVKLTCLIIGSSLVIFGSLNLLTPTERFVDNIVVSEKSIMTAFLILTGLVIGTGAVADDISKKLFKDFHRKVSSLEEED